MPPRLRDSFERCLAGLYSAKEVTFVQFHTNRLGAFGVLTPQLLPLSVDLMYRPYNSNRH